METSPAHAPRLLAVVEGPHDIEFLTRISAISHAADPSLPDLREMRLRGQLVFVPFGGGELWPWTSRLASLGQPEFHLYDREMPPVTETRHQAAAIVNLRPNCRAFVTQKRAVENYIAPAAIREARGIDLVFTDDNSVTDLAAERTFRDRGGTTPWDQLPLRARKRLRYKAKRWLNTDAVDRMTPERLAERDPAGEVRSWLATIAELARTGS